jgi:hypothetical protein
MDTAMPPKSAGQKATDRPLVTGQIIITSQSAALADASIYISLEEVSYADAPATTVAETVIPHVRHPSSQPGSRDKFGNTVLAFALHAASSATVIDLGSDYAVRVWVDREGDGRPEPGDLYSDQRNPVLTRGFGDTVMITLDSAP